MEKQNLDNELNFVTKHYRHGAFDTDRAWRRMAIRPHRWISRRAAAAVAACVVLSASAFVLTYVWHEHSAAEVAADTTAVMTNPQVAQPDHMVIHMEFTDATLTDVVAEIERVYGVKVTNLPGADHRLTLSYEGTAEDLVATINELLETELKVER